MKLKLDKNVIVLVIVYIQRLWRVMLAQLSWKKNPSRAHETHLRHFQQTDGV